MDLVHRVTDLLPKGTTIVVLILVLLDLVHRAEAGQVTVLTGNGLNPCFIGSSSQRLIIIGLMLFQGRVLILVLLDLVHREHSY